MPEAHTPLGAPDLPGALPSQQPPLAGIHDPGVPSRPEKLARSRTPAGGGNHALSLLPGHWLALSAGVPGS